MKIVKSQFVMWRIVCLGAWIVAHDVDNLFFGPGRDYLQAAME